MFIDLILMILAEGQRKFIMEERMNLLVVLHLSIASVIGTIMSLV